MQNTVKRAPDKTEDDIKTMAEESDADLRKIDQELRDGGLAVTEVATLGLRLTRLSDGNARLCVTRDGPGAEPESCVEGSGETAEEIMALLRKSGLVE